MRCSARSGEGTIPAPAFRGWLEDREFVACGAGSRGAFRAALRCNFPEVIAQRVLAFAPPGATEAAVRRLQTAAEAFARKVLVKANAVAVHRAKSCVWAADVVVTLRTLGLSPAKAVEPCSEDASVAPDLFVFGMRALAHDAGVKFLHPGALRAASKAVAHLCRDVVAVAAKLPNNRFDRMDAMLEVATRFVFDEARVLSSSEETPTDDAPRAVVDNDFDDCEAMEAMSDEEDVSSDDDVMEESLCCALSEVSTPPSRRTTTSTRGDDADDAEEEEEGERQLASDDDLSAGDVDLALKRLGIPILGPADDESGDSSGDDSSGDEELSSSSSSSDDAGVTAETLPGVWRTACPGCGRVVRFQSTPTTREGVPSRLAPFAFADARLRDDDDATAANDGELEDSVAVDWSAGLEAGRSPATRTRSLVTPQLPVRIATYHGRPTFCGSQPLARRLAETYRPPAGTPSSEPASLDQFVRSAAGGHRASVAVDDDADDLVDYFSCKLVRAACEFARTRDAFVVDLRDCYAALVDYAHRGDDGTEFGRRTLPTVVLTDWIPGLRAACERQRLSRRRRFPPPSREDDGFSEEVPGVSSSSSSSDEEDCAATLAAGSGFEFADAVAAQTDEAFDVLGIATQPEARAFLTAVVEVILRHHFARIGMLSIHAADALTTYGLRSDDARFRPKKRKLRRGSCPDRPSSDGTFGLLLPRDFLLYRRFWLNVRCFDSECMDVSSSPFPAAWF